MIKAKICRFERKFLIVLLGAIGDCNTFSMELGGKCWMLSATNGTETERGAR